MTKGSDRFLYTAVYKGEIRLVESFEKPSALPRMDTKAVVRTMFRHGDFARQLASKPPNTQVVSKVAQHEGLCLLFSAVYDVGDHAERLVVVTLSVYPRGTSQAAAGRVLESEMRASFQFLGDIRSCFSVVNANEYCDYNLFRENIRERVAFYTKELADSNSTMYFTAPATHEVLIDVSSKFEDIPPLLLSQPQSSSGGESAALLAHLEEGGSESDASDYTSVAKKKRIEHENTRDYRLAILIGAFVGIIILGWVGMTLVGVLPPVWEW